MAGCLWLLWLLSYHSKSRWNANKSSRSQLSWILNFRWIHYYRGVRRLCPRTVLAGEQFLKRGYSEARFFFFFFSKFFIHTARERRGWWVGLRDLGLKACLWSHLAWTVPTLLGRIVGPFSLPVPRWGKRAPEMRLIVVVKGSSNKSKDKRQIIISSF